MSDTLKNVLELNNTNNTHNTSGLIPNSADEFELYSMSQFIEISGIHLETPVNIEFPENMSECSDSCGCSETSSQKDSYYVTLGLKNGNHFNIHATSITIEGNGVNIQLSINTKKTSQ